MRGDEEMADQVRRAEARAGRGRYGSLDEITVPTGDERRELQEHDIDDPADAPVDTDVLRDGGPASPRGAPTTTGGTAGPASVRRTGRRRSEGKVAPTTTGDATTGGMSTPAGGSTSDQSSQATQVGNFTEP